MIKTNEEGGVEKKRTGKADKRHEEKYKNKKENYKKRSEKKTIKERKQWHTNMMKMRIKGN